MNLLPCPFCGASADVLHQVNGWLVLCHLRCGCQMLVLESSKQQAARSWNHRIIDVPSIFSMKEARQLEIIAEALRENPNLRIYSKGNRIQLVKPLNQSVMPEIQQYPGTIVQLVAEMQKLLKKDKIRLDQIPACLRPALEVWIVGKTVQEDKDETPLFFQVDIRGFWQYVLEKGLDFVVHFKN